MASSIVGFRGIASSKKLGASILPWSRGWRSRFLSFLAGNFYLPFERELRRQFGTRPGSHLPSGTVRLRDTFIPRTDVGTPPKSPPFATSLFDSVISALLAYGMEIALFLVYKCVLRI